MLDETALGQFQLETDVAAAENLVLFVTFAGLPPDAPRFSFLVPVIHE